jgi:DNA-3-methyladenine glycosylase
MKAIISPTATHPESFYSRSTVKVSKDLLGCSLNRRLPSGLILSAEISEVEAYTANDPACHAFRGKTKRTEVLFGLPGLAYVYFIYGMYYCLNVVTEPEGIPGAILIRALHSTAPNGANLNGPGKICKHWQIDKSFNGVDLMDASSALWITQRPPGHKPKILISERIGISQAQDKLWRFYTTL